MPTIITRGAVSAKAYGFGVSGGYSVSKSLRFRSSASAYLNRTPASASNRKTWTWSGWVKRGLLNIDGTLFSSRPLGSSTPYGFLTFNTSTDILAWNGNSGDALYTTQVFRDPSAWYHIMFVVDTTQATASNRLKMYINGVQVTSFGIANYPTQNTDLAVNASQLHTINVTTNGAGSYASYFDGYLAEVNFIDGQALTPSSFGTYDTNGVWQPIKYSGSFGTNGFYLNFGNTTSTTTLGYDTSGNSNNWTTNNISLTAGSTYDSMTDSPTVSSASVANYCVFNPLDKGTNLSVANANLNISIGGTGGNDIGRSTFAIPQSGKWYWEFYVNTIGSGVHPGIITASVTLNSGSGTLYGVWYNSADGTKTTTWGTNTAYGSSFTTGDTIGVAYDAGANSIVFYKNNTSQGSITHLAMVLHIFRVYFCKPAQAFH